MTECDECVHYYDGACHVYVSDAWPPPPAEGDACPWRFEGDDAND